MTIKKKSSPDKSYLNLAVGLNCLLNNPLQAVFDAWTDSTQLAQWWGPTGFTNPVCKVDVRPGGKIQIHMRAPDGTIFPMGGVYKEVMEPKGLLFTSYALDKKGKPMFEVLNKITFATQGKKTKVTVAARVIKTTDTAPEYLDGMKLGWAQTLVRLAAFLAKPAKQKQKAKTSTNTADREIVLTRLVNAPPARSFKAWTDARQMPKWWGPNGFTTTLQEMDVKEGGLARYIMHGPDGTDYDNLMEFHEVTKPNRLVYKHGEKKNDPSAFDVTVTFDKQGDKTKVTLKSVFPSKKERDKVIKFGAVEMGNQTLGRLNDYLTKNK